MRAAIDDEAHANDHGAGNAACSAPVTVETFPGISGCLRWNVGSLTDVASANNWGGGVAIALAHAREAAAAFFAASNHVVGKVLVAASAHDYSGASAVANAGLSLGGSLLAVDGDICLSRATNDKDGEARSRAALAIGSVANASSIHLANVLVDALASERGVGPASALALTDIRAERGNGTDGHSHSGNITMSSLADGASAISLHGGKAAAVANVNVQASGELRVNGPIAASANANNLGGGGLARSLADVTIQSLLAPTALIRPGPVQIVGVSVLAHGTNLGWGGAEAQGKFALGGVGSEVVEIGDVLIDAVALDQGPNAGGGALADASFVTHGKSAYGSEVDFVQEPLAFHSIDVHALASSQGSGGARATALTRLSQGVGGPPTPMPLQVLLVQDGITVSATALTGPAAHSNASALANLNLHASGNGLAHMTIKGPIDVRAQASDHGAGSASRLGAHPSYYRRRWSHN